MNFNVNSPKYFMRHNYTKKMIVYLKFKLK